MIEDDPRMSLPDTVTCFNGEQFSETWFQEVWKPLFSSRRCDRCKETGPVLGVFLPGTTKYATSVIFGYRLDFAEKIIKSLGLFAFCQGCFNKLRYNGSGVPPTATQILTAWRKTKNE